MKSPVRDRWAPTAAMWSVGLLSLVAWSSCSSNNNDNPAGAGITPLPTPTTASPTSPLPGVALSIVRVEGGTGLNGNLKAGDKPRVTFLVREGAASSAAGQPIPPARWALQELLFAGPSSNYQLVKSYSNLANNSKQNVDGSWTFTFPDAIPAVVPNQINQANTIPYDSGTLAGQDMPSGTYTFGISVRRDITIGTDVFRDAASTTKDVLFGAATTLTRSQLVTDQNCQNCHTTLRAHGENRYGVAMCVLCHTNGAEDLNNPNAVAGETLGLSISFQTMIHKIHSGAHLPSVNGKTVDANGNPVYGTGTPYVIVSSRGEFDFSEVAFPQWPHLAQGMPRDLGYNALTTASKTAEGKILSGPTNCAACHGDPDGDGPLPAPTNGDAIFTNAIKTRACIACHDDWDPSKPYVSNGMTMPAGLSDATCNECHAEAPTNPNSAINVRKAHTHPLLDSNTPPLWGAGAGERGLKFNVLSVGEATTGNGLLEAGEKVAVEVQVVNGDGAAVAASAIKRMEVVISGPVQNPNSLYFASYIPASSTTPSPTTILTGAGPNYTFTLKEKIPYEIATPLSATTFTTARAPHFPTQFGTPGATTIYTVATGSASTVTLTDDVPAYQNFVDVSSAASLALAIGNVVVIDEGNASREYLEVRNIDGNRIWFAAPNDSPAIRLAKPHAAGAAIAKVTPVVATGTTLDSVTGVITFAAAPTGNVLVTYTTDFVMPSVYRGAINNSPSLDPADPQLDAKIGEWTGFGIVPGTYNIGVYGEVAFDVTVAGTTPQITTYTEGSSGNTVKAFRIGTAGALETNNRISGEQNCYSCHRDLQFHGSHRRGYDNCMLCHGNAGSEDWPIFKTAALNSPRTPGVTIEFREMIHKIHRGHELEAGADYVVAGNSGSVHTYEHVGFPSFLGATANCASCHGATNTAWKEPTLRLHPDESRLAPHLEWRMVCGSCHDGRAAYSHMLSNSGGNVEGCTLCHGAGKELSVETVHKNQAR